MGYIRRKRMYIVALLVIVMILDGCTTLLNGNLEIEYLTDAEREEIEAQEGIGAMLNYRDSVFSPQAYVSEYPDAFYIPEEYSREAKDVRGFELLDFVNGDTFIYAYQTMVYKNTGEAAAIVPISGDYVYCENGVTEDTRELSGQMVTVLAANRYTAGNSGEGYRVLQSWITQDTDQQTFFASTSGEWMDDGTNRQTARTGSYAVYFNGHAVVYKAAVVQDALERGTDPDFLINYDFSKIIMNITNEILEDGKIDSRDRAQYEFDIQNVSFSAGEDYVDVYMTVTQSKVEREDELEEESARVDQIMEHPEASGEKEAGDESQYQMKSYDVRMGFYMMNRPIVCNIENINYDRQSEYFMTNGDRKSADYEWNVSQNDTFLTKEDVLAEIPSEYEGFFLEDDSSAYAFAINEDTCKNYVCNSCQFSIDGYNITGQLRMTDQKEGSAVRQGYYMVSDNKVESDMEADFIRSRTFTVDRPRVLAYQWNSQRQQGDRQYSKCFVTGDLLIYYATYIPDGDSGGGLSSLGIDRSCNVYVGNDWNSFLERFIYMKYWDPRQCVNDIPAVDGVTGKVSAGELYILCYTQEGVYLYQIRTDAMKRVPYYVIGSSLLLEYNKLNVLAVCDRSDPDGMVSDTTPEIFPDYSINEVSGLWTENQEYDRAWTVCTVDAGLEIIKENGKPYLPVFQKNVIYEDKNVTDNETAAYFQQLTRLDRGVAAYAIFENQGEDKASYPYLLLGYDYQGGVYTDMDIVRAKVMPFAVVDPNRMSGNVADEAWRRLSAEPGECRVYYLKDCYDRSIYGTVRSVEGYHNETEKPAD